MQLAEAEAVGALDDQGVGVGDVQAGLDDRGADEHVELLVPEVEDDLLEPVLAHLAVGGGDAGLGHQLADAGGGPLDRGHLVVDEEDLALAQQLAPDRRGDLLLVVRADEGEDGVPLLRRGGQGGHLADAGDRHLQGARDRRRGHGQHVDGGAQPLELLLVLDAEALLLVDDDQAEVLERDLAREQAVGADDQVDRAVLEPGDDLLGLGVALEPGQGLDHDGELGVALGEGLQVLLDQQRGRHEDRDLLAVLDRLERRPDRDLGLAVADVAADEPVHRDRALHVGLDLVDADQLVGGLDVGEGVLELALPRGVGAEGVALGGHPGAVEPDQLAGDLLDVLLGPALGLLPVGAAQLVQRRGLAADVAGDLVELVGRHGQPVGRLAALAGGVLDDEVLAGGAADGALHHLDEPAHAVLLVDDEVAGPQLQRVDLVAPARGHPAHVLGGRALPGGAGEVGLGDDDQPRLGGDEALAHRAGRDVRDARLEADLAAVLQPAGHVVLAEDLDHALGQARAVGDDDDLPAVARPSRRRSATADGVSPR